MVAALAATARVRAPTSVACVSWSSLPSAAEYESARSSYCDEQRKLLEYVEDAITGSDLLIKEQVIYVNTGDSGALIIYLPAGGSC